MIQNFDGTPFGSRSERFRSIGIHPKALFQAEHNTKIGPGSYDVIDHSGFNCASAWKHPDGLDWARQYHTSKMSAIPQTKCRDLYDQKLEQKQKLGPGTYESKDFLQLANEKPHSNRGMLDALDQRFKDRMTVTVPGPGTYGKGGIPHAEIEEKSMWSSSKYGLMESKTSRDGMSTETGSGLGPGTHKTPASFTDIITNRLVSVRGPYDLFSEDRGKPIKTGHLATLITHNLGPGEYGNKSTTDVLNDRSKKHIGRFGKLAQYPNPPTDRITMFSLANKPRNPSDPGPDHYNPKIISKPMTQATKLPPFQSSTQRNDRMAQKFFTRNFNPVGVGRYDIQRIDTSKHRNGCESAFKSKTDRPEGIKLKYMQERVKACNIRDEDLIYLVPPTRPYDTITQKITANNPLFTAA